MDAQTTCQPSNDSGLSEVSLPTVSYREGERTFTLQKLLEAAKLELRRTYGVRDLSTIEGVHLRHCVQECGERIDKQWKSLALGDGKRSDIASIPDEAARLWLIRVWRFTNEELHRETKIMGCVSWEFAKAIQYIRESDHLV